MIDHVQRYENVVKDELAKACQANGISKDEAGYVVSGFGAVELVINEQTGTAVPMPVWAVTVSLRSLLLGKAPVGGRLQIPGVLPPESEFRVAAKRMVSAVDQARQAEFRGEVN